MMTEEPRWVLKDVKGDFFCTTQLGKRLIIDDLESWLGLIIKSSEKLSRKKKMDFMLVFNAMLTLLTTVLGSDGLKPNLYREDRHE